MFKPNFKITPKILSAISQIAEVKAVIERSRVLPLNEAQLRRQAIVRMAHTSTSIEGNKLAEYQVDKVLSGMSVAADQKSIMEVKNYQNAIKEMEKISQDPKPLNMEMVLKLHTILIEGLLEKEKMGRFRKGPIYVIDDLGDGREHLRFEGPQPERVPFLINELLLWLAKANEQAIHPIIQAGVFHLQLVTIHPFSDGNGRLSRLLTTYILYKNGWDFRKILVLEDYYNRDRLAYYNAENEVQGHKYEEGHDMTSWLEYFVQGFLVEAKKIEEAIISAGFGKPQEAGKQTFLDRDEWKIVDFLTTTGKITSQDVQTVLNIAKRTAQLKLKNLVDKQLIKPQGKGPSTYYVLIG